MTHLGAAPPDVQMQEPTVRVLPYRALNLKSYEKRSAEETDYTELITEPTLVYDADQGKVKIVYLELADDHTAVVEAIKRQHYPKDTRTNGMMTRNRTIGYLPRVKIRRDYCTASLMAREDPEAHALILSYAERVSTYYQKYNPELYAEHQRQVQSVLSDYRVGGTSVFTSGIINKDNPLPYHHDAGNFPRVWSNMLVFKHKIAGGYLSVPEYDVGFELKDNSLLMFDGQSILHGVTPIRRQHPKSHRYSVVFYSMQQLWNCLPPEQEVERFRKERSEVERRRWERERKAKGK